MTLEQAPYLFVVDTDSYSGNFERELVGYMTGSDNGTHGGKEAENFKKFFPEEAEKFKEIIMEVLDEHDMYSVAHIYPTPGRFNHGLGVHYDEGADMDAVRKSYIEKVDEYYVPRLKQAEKAIEQGKSEWERTAEIYRHLIQQARTEPIMKFFAYESVAVAFSQKPSEDQITMMKNRAQEFATITNSFNIKAFRLIEQKTHTCKTTQTFPLN